MGTTSYGTSKSKFEKNEKYKSLCEVLTPFGVISAGIIHTGSLWETLLTYEVGNGFETMFELINENK